MRAFLSYPYKEDIEPFALGVKEFLIKQRLEIEDGKWPDATVDLGIDIAEKIKGCDILVAFLVEHPLSRWIDQEVGIAVGAGLDVILISEGNIERTGLLTNHYHISRSKGDLMLCASITHTLNCIKEKRGVESELPISFEAPEGELVAEDWPEDIQRKIYMLRRIFSENAYEKALKEAMQFAAEHPECWRFQISKTSALIHLRRFKDARKVLTSVSKKFAGTPRALSYAYDNMGWLIDQECAKVSQASLEDALACYKAAKHSEKRSNVYLNLVQCFLELDRVSEAEAEFEEWLIWDSDAINKLHAQIEIQGARFVEAVIRSKLLSALLFRRRRR